MSATLPIGMSAEEMKWKNVDARTDYNNVVMRNRHCHIETHDRRLVLGCNKQAAVEIRAYMEFHDMMRRYPGAQREMARRIGGEANVYHTEDGPFLIYAIFWPCRDCYPAMLHLAVNMGRSDKMMDSFLVMEVMGPKLGRPRLRRGKSIAIGDEMDMRIHRQPRTPLGPGEHRSLVATDGSVLVRGNLGGKERCPIITPHSAE